MENRLDILFHEWHRLGGSVLLSKTEKIELNRSSEEVLAESTSYCRQSGRLMWIVLDWYIRNIEKINADKLIQKAKEEGDLSVLGLLSDLAYARKKNEKFKYIKLVCNPNRKIEMFFYRVAKSPLATKITKEHSLKIFSRWNYLCNEIRYLT